MSPTDRMLRSLVERSLSSDADSVKTTFSSWDSCMAKAYCKWPVIAGIIVGSLIILGIVGCLVSCLCCGYQCCKGCCGCCYKCCDCGGSRHDRRGGRDKYADDPQPYYQQPPPPEPMNFGYRQPVAAPSAVSVGPPPAYRGPQTATFDQPTKAPVNEDELPPMPTWADAQTRHVENHDVEHEAVEMDDLKGIRDHAKSPMQHEGVTPAPVAGSLSRGLSRGGYNEVPGTYPSSHPSPQPMYDNGYSPNGNGAYGGHGGYGEHDGFSPQADQGYYGAPPDTHYFNQHPQSPGPQSPEYGQPPVGFPPRASPRGSPAPYRGFGNQPAPRVQAQNFSGPTAYNNVPSPRSPPAMIPGYSPYDQQPQHQSAYPSTRSPPPTVRPAYPGGYSPYDHEQQADYQYPSTRSPPPAMQSAQSQGQYRAFSPRIASPPSHQAPNSYFEDPAHQSPNGEERPPSLLMAGRRPAPNSSRAV